MGIIFNKKVVFSAGVRNVVTRSANLMMKQNFLIYIIKYGSYSP